MGAQTYIAVVFLMLSIGYLGWRAVGSYVKKSDKEDGCGPDCKCG